MSQVRLDFRIGENISFLETPMAFANCAIASEVTPVRLAATFKGQRSMPGFFWMSRMNSHLMYESKLEMVTLLQLDFNLSVAHVVPQPFTMHFQDRNKPYRHTPDFFVLYADSSGEVVNVKPKKYVLKERNQRAFTACQSLSAEMGFAYTTRSEPDSVLLANLWWLSGYRRRPARLEEFSGYLLDAAARSLTVEEILEHADSQILIRPVLFYLIWNRILDVNMYERMNKNSKITLSKDRNHAK